MKDVIFARFWGCFFWSFGISAAIATLNHFHILQSTSQSLGIAMVVGISIYVIAQILECRMDFSVMQDIPEYLIINISAYLIFAVISMISRPLLNMLGGFFDHGAAGNIIHTWLFGIQKAAIFSRANITWFESSLIFHGGMILSIFIAPIGMQGYFFYEDIGR